jgi:TrmH family RNA methyltransferase
VILVLDGIQDPGNFGTLVRAADAFRTAAVIALPGTVDAWNPKAVRAAAGSSFRVPILSLEDEQALEWLERAGFTVLVADADGTAVDLLTPPERAALVVGNEGAGVRALWRAAADAIVAVPTPGPVESLNVALASGILLYALTTHIRDRNG